jgi:two-component system chemotaxis sensor kinase CheA
VRDPRPLADVRVTEDTVVEFLVESTENLDRLELDLVELERRPGDTQRLAGIFRTVHTIKGTCGFLAFDTLAAVSHAGESLLVNLRDGVRDVDHEAATALLSMVDAIRRILGHIEACGVEPPDDYAQLIATLSALAVPRGLQAVAAGGGDLGDARRAGLEGGVGAGRLGPTSDATVRVEVDMLRRMTDLVDELVLARNELVGPDANCNEQTRADIARRLDRVTSQLQACVHQTRTQPVGTTWARFPRLVRDLAAQLGKQVELKMDGLETRVDRAIIEAIRDPLTHMVRNAVDHGLERPGARLAAGKSVVGRLRLSACRQGDHVRIEVSDDGRGIDPATVRATAVSRGIASADQVARLSDREAIDLVFQPGFSTADQVTSLSGRGVGMDVVKTNIERVGGCIDLDSRAGVGLTFRITIPLTVAGTLRGEP